MSRTLIERARARTHFARSESTPRPLAQVVVRYRSSIVDVAHVGRDNDRYSVGEAPEASFKLALDELGSTTLVERVGSGYVLSVPSGFVLDGREAAPSRVELRAGERLSLTRGELRFDVSLVEPEAIEAGRASLDRPFWASFVGNATLATVAYLLMRAIPADPMDVALEDEAAKARFASYFDQADLVNEESVEAVVVEPESNGSVAGDAGPRAKGREGKRGGGTSTRRVPSLARPGLGDPGLSRSSNPVAAAETAGILGILAAQNQTFLASAESAFGSSEADALLWANSEGLMGDGHGLALAGDGYRGGGTADNAVGLSTGMLGHGVGTNSLHDRPGVPIGPRKPRAPRVDVREVTTTGGIDRDVVRRIIRAHINEVRGCYNAALSRNPNLEGRVTVQFTILGGGKVSSAAVTQNSTKDSSLADCVVKAVKRWTFPARGGPAVIVSYPFMLRAG